MVVAVQKEVVCSGFFCTITCRGRKDGISSEGLLSPDSSPRASVTKVGALLPVSLKGRLNLKGKVPAKHLHSIYCVPDTVYV